MAHITKRTRSTGEAREIRDEEWLRLHQGGMSTSAIAEAAGVSVQLVRRALVRAREQEASRIEDDGGLALQVRDSEIGDEGVPPAKPTRTPWWLELVPIFPITSFTPHSECPHRGPIREGSLFCCMVCSSSGMDHHPGFRRDPATDPSPEPTAPAAAAPPARKAEPLRNVPIALPAVETRRERRSRQFAAAGTPAGAATLPLMPFPPQETAPKSCGRRESCQCNRGDTPCRFRETA